MIAGLRQINTCRQVPLLVQLFPHFPCPFYIPSPSSCPTVICLIQKIDCRRKGDIYICLPHAWTSLQRLCGAIFLISPIVFYFLYQLSFLFSLISSSILLLFCCFIPVSYSCYSLTFSKSTFFFCQVFLFSSP